MISHRDPHARLNELQDHVREARGNIRALLDEVAEKYGVAKRDVDLAMLSVEDMLGDLTYGARSDMEGEIVDEMPAD